MGCFLFELRNHYEVIICFSSSAQKRPRSNDTPVTMSISHTYFFVSKYHFPLKETRASYRHGWLRIWGREKQKWYRNILHQVEKMCSKINGAMSKGQRSLDLKKKKYNESLVIIKKEGIGKFFSKKNISK